MSLRTLTDAWENSPYTGNALLVHLAIADVVNPDNDYKLWMVRERIAAKARVSIATVTRVRAQMVDDGWLVPPEGAAGGRGRAAEYVYVLGGAPPSEKPAHGEPLHKPAHTEQETGSPETETGSGGESSPLSQHKNLTRTERPTPADEAWHLANLLADLIARDGTRRPNVTQTWARDIDRAHRLDERGWREIEAVIRWCQSDHFWSMNILSPAKLRKHFDRLKKEARKGGTKVRDVYAELGIERPTRPTNGDALDVRSTG